MGATSWLLLLYSLPTRQKTERVAVWRRLKKIGAVQIKTSTYLLPDNPPQYEHFQWLAQQIRDFGGDATLVRVQEIEGLSNEKLIALFNGARDEEYSTIKTALHGFLARGRKADPDKSRRTGTAHASVPGNPRYRFFSKLERAGRPNAFTARRGNA